MARVVVTPAALEDLDLLIRTHSLPPDARERLKRSLRPLTRFPRLSAELGGRFEGFRFVLGPWRWMLVVYVPHTTAAVTINENADPDVKSDLLAKLSSLVPKNETYYRHGEGNSDSHLKAAMVGHTVTVLVEAGRLVLGRWQGVYFCEFDGPRQRELIIKALKFGPAESD